MVRCANRERARLDIPVGETKPGNDDRAPPPRDDLTACRVVIYANVAILPLSLLATRLDRGLFGLPFETKEEVL